MSSILDNYTSEQPKAALPTDRPSVLDSYSAAPEAQQAVGSGGQPMGPNPELNWDTAKRAVGDIAHQTPPGQRTFVPQVDQNPVEGAAPMVMPAGAAPGLAKLAEFLNSSYKLRAATGGVQGAVTDRENPLRGAAIGAGTSLGGDALGSLLGKSGDRAMQWAVGRKKYTPGVGTELADQGLVGTKNMMRDQTQKRLAKVGGQMSSVADEIPAIDARKIGREIIDSESAAYTGRGINTPRERDLPIMEKIQKFGDDISAGGTETGAQALARRKTAGSTAFSQKSQEPLQNVNAKLSKAEQRAYSQALKEADPRMVPLDKTYGALKRAELPLNQEEAIGGFGGLVSSVGKALAQPAASVAGQGAVKSGQAVDWLNNPLLRQLILGKVAGE